MCFYPRLSDCNNTTLKERCLNPWQPHIELMEEFERFLNFSSPELTTRYVKYIVALSLKVVTSHFKDWLPTKFTTSKI